jgi:hypothetical protein
MALEINLKCRGDSEYEVEGVYIHEPQQRGEKKNPVSVTEGFGHKGNFCLIDDEYNQSASNQTVHVSSVINKLHLSVSFN